MPVRRWWHSGRPAEWPSQGSWGRCAVWRGLACPGPDGVVLREHLPTAESAALHWWAEQGE